MQAVVVETETGELTSLDEVRCASCCNPLGDRPRAHNYPARRAATRIAQGFASCRVDGVVVRFRTYPTVQQHPVGGR